MNILVSTVIAAAAVGYFVIPWLFTARGLFEQMITLFPR